MGLFVCVLRVDACRWMVFSGWDGVHYLTNRLVEQERLAHVLDFGDRAAQVEGLG
jgi:hypothetical protein